MVKYARLALPFAALLNSVVVSAFLVPIPPSLNGDTSSTTITSASLTSTPTETTTSEVMTSITTNPSQPTASPESTIQTARFLKSRQVHNADYAANKNNVADSAAASPEPSSTEQPGDAASDTPVDSTAASPAPTAAYDQRM